jgi:predicted permease
MSLLRRILAFGKRSQVDKEIEDELRAHVAMRTEDNVAAGMSPDSAARDARLRFGNPTVVRERVEGADLALGIASMGRDLRYAIRGYFKSPGFTAVAIITLALGIGANTAIFQLLDAVRLRSLPVENPQELAEVRIVGGNRGFGINDGMYAQLTRPIWEEIQRHHEPFSRVFAWRNNDRLLGQLTDPHRIHGFDVSGDFFAVLGIHPWQGRLILPEDEASARAAPRAVVSYPFWQAQMGGRGLGTTLMIDGTPAEVIGVTPPGFFGMAVGESFDVAFPLCEPNPTRREVFDVSVMGRLKPGWTTERASAYFGALSAGIFDATAPTGYSADAIKHFKEYRLGVYPASGGVSSLREAYDTSLWLLLAITGLVLLIACANLANLMLARATTRQREMAMRMALGASRNCLLRQLLMESGLLAVAGAVLGVAIAQVFSRILVWSLSTRDGSVHLSIGADWRVLLFAAAAAGLTCVVFGTLPAIRATNTDPITALKPGARGLTASRERFSVQRSMVVTQISVSLVLLVGALLFVRSFRNLMTLNPGMRERGITVGFFGFPLSNVEQKQRAEFKRQLLEDVKSVPGVQNAATTTNVPLNGSSWTHGIHVGGSEGSSKFTWVSPGYFDTMDIPLLTGRNLSETDTEDSPRVAVVNQTFIRQFLGQTNPIGQLVRTLPEPQYPSSVYEIVGTIPDTKYSDLRGETPPMVFAPASQFPVTAQQKWAAMMIDSGNAQPATVAIKRAFAEKHPQVVLQFFDFQEGIRDNLVRDRLMAILSGFFGVLATVLVMVGLYGVLSYLVTLRRNEIGIRIALGARRGQVIGLVMRDAATMLLAGVIIGTVLALVAGRGASSMLFGLKPYDPATLTFAVALLAVIAALASFLPARRAARLDPMVALRNE